MYESLQNNIFSTHRIQLHAFITNTITNIYIKVLYKSAELCLITYTVNYVAVYIDSITAYQLMINMAARLCVRD